jgi:hypothetical protein
MKNSPIATKRLITKEELAEHLSLKVRGIQTLTERGVIPVIRISHRCVRYDLDRVLEALAHREVPEVSRKGKR